MPKKKKKIREAEIAEWKRVVLKPLYGTYTWTLVAGLILLVVYGVTGKQGPPGSFIDYALIPMSGLLAVILYMRFFLGNLAMHCTSTTVAVTVIILLNVYMAICLCSYGDVAHMMIVVFFPMIIAPIYRKKSLVYIQVAASLVILLYAEMIHIPFIRQRCHSATTVVTDQWEMHISDVSPNPGLEAFTNAIVIVLLFYVMVRFELEVMKTANILGEQGSRDSLTQLLNHEAFYEALDEQMQQFAGTKEAFSIIVADIDNFKKVNDTYGHAFGDEVIRQVGEVIRGVSNGGDICARYGGEEFSVILPGKSLRDAAQHAERIRRRFADTQFKTEDKKTLHFTLSIGVAEHNQKYRTASDFFERADKALYEAKRTGKNKVCCWRLSDENGIQNEMADDI